MEMRNISLVSLLLIEKWHYDASISEKDNTYIIVILQQKKQIVSKLFHWSAWLKTVSNT